jgi:CubicO group peptidase (beta-lactamase class C family)
MLNATSALALSDDDLRAALEQRFKNDRTGACIAAAGIDHGTTARAYFCADANSQRPYDEHTAFEIGSNSKPMTAALLAEFIARGEITLDDPIAKLLPRGTRVPSFNGRQITIGDIVTHTSGLPRFPWRGTDRNNPYAHLTELDLLGTLAATQLTRPPGSQWEYSNFAMMVLSYALAKRSGKDFETLLRERLLAPLGMKDTYVARRPLHVRLAQGHLSVARPTAPWDFPPSMAGVGGVRSTLPDMLRYLEGHLGIRQTAITPAFARTQEEVASVSGHTMGMAWNLIARSGRTVVAHDGGTGGYSSYAAFDRTGQRAVVLLSDTALTSVSGLGRLGLSLLNPSVPAGGPRIVATAEAKLIDALVGKYRLRNGLGVELRHKGNALTTRADGQPEFKMGYDSWGDFYPLEFDARLRPKRKADRTYTFTWYQGGAALEAERTGTPPPVQLISKPTEAQLNDYVGNYSIAPGFGLRVFAEEGKLFVQGINPIPFELASVDADIFVTEAVGLEIDFERDANGKVNGLINKQPDVVVRGERQ